ncbi:hypothetical protein N7G274_010498 [Stereocaulon virgatum]|uniref:Carboxylesterase type B domain-containing protein n=1 Tax=Stereocaulon virgatum TaxID=373712 RepID=A0ABR3ZUH4_9LECA
MRLNFVYFLALLTIYHGAPAKLGLSFDNGANALPTLTLPYATYQATNYNPNGGIYTFKNVRFAAPPIGKIRWARPAPPLTETNTQDGSYGLICIQAPIKGPQLTGSGASSAVGRAANQFLAGIPVPSFANMSEDCLFLDVYVSAAAVRNPSLKLPVISWFYRGAYILGGKDQFGNVLPLYDGTGLIQQSGGNVTFVASNYRVYLLLRITMGNADDLRSLVHMAFSPAPQWSRKVFRMLDCMTSEQHFSGFKTHPTSGRRQNTGLRMGRICWGRFRHASTSGIRRVPRPTILEGSESKPGFRLEFR